MKITDTHAQYTTRQPQWKRCRDAFEGGDAVKKARETYLKKLPGQTNDEYQDYLDRAIWYDACKATLDLYTGMVFSKPVQYQDIDLQDPLVTDADMAGKPFSEVMESALDDVLKFNRYGILVDFAGLIPEGVSPQDARSSEVRPFCASYSCFDIINWHRARIGGRMLLDRVVLKEGERKIRELLLDATGYHVRVWEKPEALGGLPAAAEWSVTAEITPLMRGAALREIPFCFFDAEYGSSDCQTPPLLGLVDINLSHYRTMADLEHGRFFCGLPTPIFAGFQFTENDKVALGSMNGISAADSTAKAYYLEFTGSGLAALESAAKQKEEWMSHLGGGLLNPAFTGAEAAETMKIRRSGANATLASVASAVSMVGTKVLSLMAEWGGAGPCTVQLNTEYLPANITPQEIDTLLRAVQSGDFRRLDFLKRLQTGGAIAPDVDVELVNKELGDPLQGTMNG